MWYPFFCGQDNLQGGQFWAMGRLNLLGGQINLLDGQMPTQLTCYLPPCLGSLKMLHFRPCFNLNLFLGGCILHACLAYDNIAFCYMKMLISGPILVLLYIYDLGVAGLPRKENSTMDELKMPNFKPLFSLNVYDFLGVAREQPPCLLLRKFCIW